LSAGVLNIRIVTLQSSTSTRLVAHALAYRTNRRVPEECISGNEIQLNHAHCTTFAMLPEKSLQVRESHSFTRQCKW